MHKEAVDRYRQKFREGHIPKFYNGRAHLSLTVVVTVGIMVMSIYNLSAIKVIEWLTIPLVFFLANFVEHWVHKNPMHVKTRFLELIFERHTVEHHAFFTHEFMEFDEERDFNAVLFSPVMLLFFFGGIATPVGLLAYLVFGSNVAWLFVLTVTVYFLNYEILHFLYHVNKDAWTSKLPFMDKLRQHHTIHHNRRLMSDYNFNITYPICDRLFGTYYREEKSD